ncbi:monovalent cation:H+ antiporter, CPA1 (nhx1) [Elasticomyces elasticus]|nr:monovalent cation:H+ antiporter, CPA1 (nhx1) [Elasticomyces elasticus]
MWKAVGIPEFGRRNSSRQRNDAQSAAEQGLLDPEDFSTHTPGYSDDDDEDVDLDIPPAARRSPQRRSPNNDMDPNNPYPVAGSMVESEAAPQPLSTRAVLSQILNVTTEDAGNFFSKIDEGFLKQHLLLDPGWEFEGWPRRCLDLSDPAGFASFGRAMDNGRWCLVFG